MATEAQTTRTEHPYVVMTPGTCGGRPRIDGTRLSVEWLVKQLRAGDSPDDIVEIWPQVTLAALYSALSYYHDHRDEIDPIIEDADRMADDHDAQRVSAVGGL